MTDILTKASVSTPTIDNSVVPFSIKLDGTNYALWFRIVEMYRCNKDKLGYVNSDFLQPPQIDQSFRKWHTDNAIVKGWLINSMDSTLISNFIRFSIEKLVWEQNDTTFFDGNDTS